MKTHNYQVSLMTPLQTDKEIIFNEAQVKWDSFCCSSILDFIEHRPQDPITGQKYILSNPEEKGDIIYCTHTSQGWQKLSPKHGTIMFVLSLGKFFVFGDQNEWLQVDKAPYSERKDSSSDNQNPLNTKFLGIAGEFTIPSDTNTLALYLNGDCKIEISELRFTHITLIIKQHYLKSYFIEWMSGILWAQNSPHKITSTPNSVDIIQFFPMPETKHFLGTVLGKDYRY
jgi:hypothetical protein